jgi:hypothetical protein
MKTKRPGIASALTATLLCLIILVPGDAAESGRMIPAETTSRGSSHLQWQETTLEVDPERDHMRYFSVSADEGAGRSSQKTCVALGWQVLLSEDFEVLFPQFNGWQTFNSLGFAPYYWGKSNYLSHGGNYSGWCCGDHRSGNPDLNPATNPYPDDMKAWMIWGPFDLSDAADAELLFYYWLDTEEGYDFLGIMASTNGTNFYGVNTSGNSGGWAGQEEFDLTDVYTLGDLTGEPHVWIAFIFTSDVSNASTGAFLDDIVVRKEVTNTAPLIVHTPVSSAPAGQDLAITATITDDGGVTGATLYYRRSGQSSFTATAMSPSGDQYTGIVPGAEVVAPGVEYYLSATDGSLWSYHPPTDYLTSPHQVAVTDAPPVITHTAITTAQEYTDLPITATITDDASIPQAMIHYRRGGEIAFSTLTMTAAADQYSGTIAGSLVTSRGLEYYLSATDGSNTTFHPATDPTASPHVVRVQVENLVRAGSLTGGSEQTAYRMFSVPLELDDASVEAVLADDLGDYDDTRWRFFKYQNDVYNEHPDAGDIEPGQAFWLIVAQTVENIDAGSGTTVSTADSFAITLPPGWSDIGLPFDFPVSRGSLQMDSTAVNGPYAYQGQWLLPPDVTYLSPWHGYAFHNLTDSDVALKIPPVMGMGLNDDDSRHRPWAARGPGRWVIRLSARCGTSRDEFNYLGCDPLASSQRDPLDLSEPPPVGSYISLCAIHPEWKEGTGELAADFRPPNRETEIWALKVSSNCHGSPVRLTWELDERMPPGLEIRLHDLETGVDLDLRTEDHYRFVYRQERTFRLVAGPAKTIQPDARLLPQTCRLHQNYPNPFNPTTTIGYDLAADANVEVAIYNVLGERVRTLCSEWRPAGYHHLELNAQDLAAGIYFCRLTAGSYTETRKMVLLR